MRVLLIYPLATHSVKPRLPKTVETGVGFYPPMGLLYLGAYLKKYSRHSVKILDTRVERLSYIDIEKIVKEYQPHVVGIYTSTYLLYDVVETSRVVRKVNRDIHITLGGPHINLFPEETLRLPGINSIVFGEGEITFLNLVNCLETGGNLKQIAGIMFKQDGEMVRTAPASYITDLDSLPFPARELTPYKKYSSLVDQNAISTSMITSRGCPFRCIFCEVPQRKTCFRSAVNVVDEMENCASLGITEINIYDDTFNFNRERVMKICQEIERRKLKVNWSFRGRIKPIDRQMLETLYASGCIRIHYGVESGVDRILKIMNKKITVEEVRKAFQLTRKAKISTVAYFMIGFLGEKREDILETIKFAQEIEPDYTVFSITYPFPGTELYRRAVQKGIFKESIWNEFAKEPTPDFSPPPWTEELNSQEIEELAKIAYRKFYFRFTYIWQRFTNTRSGRELKRNIIGGLRVIRDLFPWKLC